MTIIAIQAWGIGLDGRWAPVSPAFLREADAVAWVRREQPLAIDAEGNLATDFLRLYAVTLPCDEVDPLPAHLVPRGA